VNPYSHGPMLLLRPEEEWPIQPNTVETQDETELKKSLFCGLNQASAPEDPEMEDCLTLEDLQKRTQIAT